MLLTLYTEFTVFNRTQYVLHSHVLTLKQDKITEYKQIETDNF